MPFDGLIEPFFRPQGSIPQGIPQVDWNAPINARLSNFWPLTNGSGFDLVGRNNLTTHGTIGYTPTPQGLAAQFTGVVGTQYLQTGTTQTLPHNGTGPFAFSFWTFLTSAPASLATFLAFGANIGGVLPPNKSTCGIINFSGGVYLWGVNNDLSSGVAFDIGRPQLITVTYDGSKIAVYKNTAQVIAPTTWSGTAWSTSQLTIGREGDNTWSSSLTGWIRFIRVWNGRCLTLSDVNALYVGDLLGGAGLIFPSDRIRSMLIGASGVLTPTDFDWDWNPQFPIRHKSQPFQFDAPPEQWPFTVPSTPASFGFGDQPQFPQRQRFHLFEEQPDLLPLSVTITPTQFGWNIDAIFPERRRWQASLYDADLFIPAAGTPTPTQFAFAYDPQFPERHRFQPFQPDEPSDQWPLTVVATPGPLGWETPTLQVMRRRPQALSQADPDPIIIPPPFVPHFQKFVYGLVSRVGWFMRR